MSAMTIRNIPAPLVESLKASARKHRRSVNQEVLMLLEEACFGRAHGGRDVEAELEEISRLRRALPTMSVEDIDAAKREGRA